PRSSGSPSCSRRSARRRPRGSRASRTIRTSGPRVSDVVEAALARAATVLANATQVALACHVNPDPDALGSMLGLAGYLQARGTTVVCSWGNQPMSPPRWLAALDGTGSIVNPTEFPARPAVIVALDTASPDRPGLP